MKSIVLISLAILCSVGSSYQQKCDQAGVKRFDDLLSEVMTTGNTKSQFPEDLEQLKTWCSKSYKHVDEIEKHNNKCNKQLYRQLLRVYVYAFRKTLKTYCKPSTKLSALLMEGSVCFNKNKNVQSKCMTNYIDEILGILNEQDDKKKIPYFCCSYSKYMNCFGETMVSLPGCSETKVTTMTDFLKSQYSQAIDLICGDYNEDSDKCVKLGEPPKKKRSQRRTKTPVIPAGELFNSFEEV